MEELNILRELESVFETFTLEMKSRYLQIRNNYRFKLCNPEYDSIRNEICVCLIIGLDQASITLTNHLMEKFFKLSLINQQINYSKIQDLKNLAQKYKQSKKDYNDKDLFYNINRACSEGIITKSEKQMLHKFRNDFRNAFSHADMDKTFKNATGFFALGKFSGALPTEFAELKIADVPPLQGLFQQNMAKQNAISYFLFIDEIICREEIKIHPEIINYQNI